MTESTSAPDPRIAFPERDYSALIFDCDGTLTDSMPIHYLAWHQTMQACGLDFPEERHYSVGGMPTNRIIEMLAREQGVVADAEAWAQAKEEAFVERLHLLQPIEPVVNVARHFRGKLPMAVASGGYRSVILRQLEQIGCHGWFDVLVTAEDTIRHKPDPDVFLLAAERMGVPPAECLVYEDSDLGLRAAAACGMDAIDIRKFHQPARVTGRLLPG